MRKADRLRWFAVVALAATLVGTAANLAAEPPQQETALQHYSTADTPIKVLLADPAARAILARHAPPFANTARAALVGNDSLKAIQGYALPVLNDQVLARIDAEFAKLPPVMLPLPVATVDEAKVRRYTLPDPLALSQGRRITRPAQWWGERRPQIVNMFETVKFGRMPARPREQRFEVFDRGTPALGGKALRRQVLIHVARDPTAPKIQLVEYLPAAARRPVPMVLMIGFSAPAAMIDDPGIRPSAVWDAATRQKVAAKPSPLGKFDPMRFLNAGFGVTTFYYGDLEPDFAEGYRLGIRGYLAQGRPRAPDAWGAVGAWAWSLSRVQDYLESDRAVDAKRVAVVGASRLGATVLWAAARDQRFAAVIACCSGKTGAALTRRNFASAFSARTPSDTLYWLAENYRQYQDRVDELPMDSHMLLALIAPRPVLLQTGKYDHAADPKGEFLAAQAATPVYRLLGKPGLEGTAWPPQEPYLSGNIGYTMNSGGHGMQPSDWGIYLQFLQKHLQ
jgi:hypothetical protein